LRDAPGAASLDAWAVPVVRAHPDERRRDAPPFPDARGGTTVLGARRGQFDRAAPSDSRVRSGNLRWAAR